VVQSLRSDDEYQWAYLSADVANAIPAAWASMVSDGTTQMLTVVTRTTGHTGFFEVATAIEGMPCRTGTGRWTTAGGYVAQGEFSATSSVTCELRPSVGLVAAPRLGTQGVAGAWWGGTDPGVCSNGAAQNALSYEPVETDALALVVPLVD
jgi:hypothetical protein